MRKYKTSVGFGFSPTRLLKWLFIVVLQGSSAVPGWFVKLIGEVVKDLDRVTTCLDKVVVGITFPCNCIYLAQGLQSSACAP